MNSRKTFIAAILLLLAIPVLANQTLTLHSPDGNQLLTVEQRANGNIFYQLTYKGKTVIAPSAMGLRLKEPAISLTAFNIPFIDSSATDNTWTQPWGEQAVVRNNYKELILHTETKGDKPVRVRIVFRLFNEGLGFRYEFPEQPNLNHFVVDQEGTQFAMTGDHKAFWIPGDFDTNEYAYYTSTLSKVDASGGGFAQEIHAKTSFDKNAVQTPLMMKSADGLYINIHEAALVNYPAMNLVVDKSNFTFTSHLVPDAVGNAAYLQTPARTPWRTINVSDKAANILMSRMILNLNEPAKTNDVSWIHPGKFVGVWWEMHVGISSWDYSGGQVGSQQATKVPHGANTANVKRYIDFAAANGIPAVLVEGWNTGWEDWFGQWKEDVFDFVTPYPDFNVKELSEYAKAKGVKIIMHHETSGSVTNYERWMDTAYRFMKQYGYDAVKTGYVGRIIPRGEHHDGQWMVKHYERVAQKTMNYHIMVDMHEPVRPTGLQRTYPNWLACEAARGNEFNAWSVGNAPDHETILPFTRLMGGPMDYTPGIFKIKMSSYNPAKTEQVHTTLAKQLALYVTMYSPLQMAADLPENYNAHMDAFQFIKDVPVDWTESRVLDAEPGDYIIEARKGKGTDSWFLGAITDENARTVKINPDFLDPNRWYHAVVYRDADDADWKANPEAYMIEKLNVFSGRQISVNLAPGGGCAISFVPFTAEETAAFKKEGAKIMKEYSKKKH